MSAPLILTLALDDAAFERLNGLRQAHFPPERNFLSAHLTLFHHLPGAEIAAVVRAVEGACGATAPFPLVFTTPKSIGRGVAFFTESGPLASLRRRLAEGFTPWLTPQDRQGFRPHVTVQNKATPEASKALLTELNATFAPINAEGRGLLLWRYMGGPWEAAGAFPFKGA